MYLERSQVRGSAGLRAGSVLSQQGRGRLRQAEVQAGHIAGSPHVLVRPNHAKPRARQHSLCTGGPNNE